MKGLTPVILIALSIGLFMYYIQPQYDKVGVLQAEIEKYDDAISAAGQLRNLRNDLVDKFNSFSTADLRRIEKFLPDQIDDVRLVLDINRIAEDNDLILEDITIDAPEEKPSEQSRLNVGTVVDESGFNILEVGFSFDATYEEFLSFISDLESSLRVIDITRLDFDVTESPSVYAFNMTLQTYWLK